MGFFEGNLGDFAKSYGALIVAIYAVLQVWLIALWKRFFWVGRLSIFRTGRLEIGFGTLGPTLALNGTLRVERKDLFVSGISLEIVKERDNSKHVFEWTAFRPPQIQIGKSEGITLELPSGFNVRVDHPHRYNIFFSDRKTQAELENNLLQVRNEWHAFLKSKEDIILHMTKEGLSSALIVDTLYDADFSKNSKAWQQAWELLTRKNYWEEGKYHLKMVVQTSSPDKRFSSEWGFELSDTSFSTLRLNSIPTLREVCFSKADYFFHFAEYS